MRIVLDPLRLDQEANRLDDVALELIEALTSVAQALEYPGLPAWVAPNRAIIGDLERQLGQVLLAARRLRARSLLARLAEGEGMGMFGLRMLMMEHTSPETFGDAVMNAAQGMALSTEVTRRGWELTGGIALGLDRWRLPTDVVKIMDSRLNAPYSDYRFKELTGKTRLRVKWELRGYQAIAKSSDAAFAANAKFVGKVLPSGINVSVDLFLQWVQDREDQFKPGDKAKRLGVTAGGSVLALIGTGFACAATTPLGCALAGGAMGVAANYGTGGFNDRHYKSLGDRDLLEARKQYARQIGEVRKVERWYLANGSPSKAFLNDRLVGAHTNTTRLPGGQKITSYYRPGTDELLAQRQQGPGYDRMQHFDSRGKRIDT